MTSDEDAEDEVDEEDGDEVSFGTAWGNTANLGGLIPNIGVGIAELIKNSYDADASAVSVDLRAAFEKNLAHAKVLISDDGHGMSFEEIRKNFFRIGDSKNLETKHRVSPKGRLRVGGKGVGRFALQKIAKKVTVITKSKGHDTFDFTIEWDTPGRSTNLEDVKHKINTSTEAYANYFPESDSHGTFLIIEELREPIDGGRLQVIHGKVISLINPFDKVPDFEIKLHVPKKHRHWGDFNTKSITKFAQYSFEASIDHMGNNVEYKFSNNHPWSDDNGTTKSGTWSTKELLGEECKIRTVKIWIFYLTTSGKITKKYVSKGGIISKRNMEKIRGFRLYRGNHRVFPYGELGTLGGDWLQLADLHGRRGSDYFKQKDLIAAVTVDTLSNPRINDMTNRSGLDETLQPEQGQLVKLLQQIVKKMRIDLCNPLPKEEPMWMNPPSFMYKISSSFTVNDEVSLLPQLSNIIPNKWELQGDLPKGLQFDKECGVIHGTVAESLDQTRELTVIGSNDYGKHRFVLYIEVQPLVEINEIVPVIVDEPIEDLDEDEIDTPSPDNVATNLKIRIQNNLDVATNQLNQVTSSKDIYSMRRNLQSARDTIDHILEKLDE